jgi:hypothetical protein
VLGGMLAAPVLSVSGCGGSGGVMPAAIVPGDAVPAGPSDPIGPGALSAGGQVKQPFVYYVYSGDKLETTQQNLHTVPNNVTTTEDRFAQGALCYNFAGTGSSVTVDGIEGFPTEDFALLLWLNSSGKARMELLRITGSGGTSMVIETGGISGAVRRRVRREAARDLLSITWNGAVVATVFAADAVHTLADGAWHHLTVQRYEGSLQVFVDGAIRGAYQTTVPLPAGATVLIGDGWQGAIDDVRLYNRAFPAQSLPRCVYRWRNVKASTSLATGNLDAYFPFYGNALNYLGYGAEGIPNNVTLTSDRNESSDAAYLFNGTDSSVTLTPGFDSTAGDFAIGFWERSSATGQMTALSVSSGGVAGSSLDLVFNGAAAPQIYVNGVASPALTVGTSGALTDGNWHFVFLQRVATTLQLYVDSALVATTDNTSIFFGSTSVIRFGAGSGASAAVASYWNGALDDVQIYAGDSLTPQEIEAVQGLAFLGRDGAGALSFQGKLWLLGGWNPAYLPVTNSEVWSSEDGVNWKLVTLAPWERRHDAGYAVFNNKMWIVGGDKNTGHYQNNVWSSADGVNWELVTDNVPWANRATQYVLTFNDRLWLMGGQKIFESSTPVVAFNDVWSSWDGANWQQETPNAAWSPRGLIMGSVEFQGRVWVIGGGQYDVRTFNNDVWSSADGVHWTLVLAQAPWSPRQFHNITVFDNKIWVLAGGDAQNQGGVNDIWYSTDGVQWTQLEATPWTPRHAASTIVQNSYLWLLCGSDSSGDNDVWKMGYAP